MERLNSFSIFILGTSYLAPQLLLLRNVVETRRFILKSFSGVLLFRTCNLLRRNVGRYASLGCCKQKAFILYILR